MNSSKFLEYGAINLIGYDEQNVEFEIKIPFCLFQIVQPTLIQYGILDKFSISQPIASWFPKLSLNQINPLLNNHIENMHEVISKMVENKVLETLHLFSELSAALIDPMNMLPMLPIGVYINVKYRCEIKNIFNILEETEKSANQIGIPDFRFALASVFADLLQKR
jgi:hypothetical protein